MEIRQYQEGDELEILKLFKLVFKQEMTMDYWKWRFKDNPYTDEVLISLMWEGKELIGHYAVSPVEMLFEGKAIKTALSMTTMTHPEHGGKGIFSQLAGHLYNEMESKGYKMVWGFPNNNSHYGFVKNLNWKDIAIIPMMSAQIGEIRLKPEEKNNHTILKSFDPDVLSSIQNSEKSIKIHKTREYLEWRYITNPSQEYKILNLEKENGLAVYKIIPAFDNNQKWEVDLMELDFNQDLDILKNMINAILQEEPSKDVIKFNLWYSIFSEDRILLEKLGFKIGLPLTYLGHLSFEDSEVISNYKNWEIGLGYSDVF